MNKKQGRSFTHKNKNKTAFVLYVKKIQSIGHPLMFTQIT